MSEENVKYAEENFNTELVPWTRDYDWKKIKSLYGNPKYKIRIYKSSSFKQHVIDFIFDYSDADLERLKDKLTINGKYFECTEEGVKDAVTYCAGLDRNAVKNKKKKVYVLGRKHKQFYITFNGNKFEIKPYDENLESMEMLKIMIGEHYLYSGTYAECAAFKRGYEHGYSIMKMYLKSVFEKNISMDFTE